MKKICFITTIGGTLRVFVLKLAEYLHKTGEFDISFLCTPEDALTKMLPDYIHLIPVPMERGISIRGFKAMLQMRKIFKEEKFDIVQYSTPNASCYASIASWFARVPVRLYPALPERAYNEMIDKNVFLSVSDNSLSIQEYSNAVDFTILSSSSVLIDLVYLGKPVYRLKVTDEDTYSTVQTNSFSNLEEFKDAFNKSEGMNELFDYLCTTREVAVSYQNILNELLGVS